MERAVQHAVDSSISGVRNALADDGYHPFMLRAVSVDRSASSVKIRAFFIVLFPGMVGGFAGGLLPVSSM